MKEISMDFFRDEVRNGFFIPTVIKQAWAAQLQVLDVIDTICRKHGITYFADWGTILGTVRHGGYVPWDDDLDICMKREDYVRFKEVARTELPEHFCIHDYEHKEDHWEFLARVVNHEHICYDLDHLKEFHNFPYLTAIDIFVLDYLYKDEQQEKQRCEEVKYIIRILTGDWMLVIWGSNCTVWQRNRWPVCRKSSLTGWRRYSHGGCWENVERIKNITGNL